MRIISKQALHGYYEKVPATKGDIQCWHAEVKSAMWSTPAELKTRYPSASILKGGRVVFNICGNKHRLVVEINYRFKIVYIKFIGTHKEYDRIDPQTVR